MARELKKASMGLRDLPLGLSFKKPFSMVMVEPGGITVNIVGFNMHPIFNLKNKHFGES